MWAYELQIQQLNVYDLEQILLSEDYETQEEIDHRLADEYKQFKIYELSDEQMLEFARAGELAYGGK